MQIMKRAKGGGEIVPFNASEADVKAEVDRRTHKAGFTTRDGNPTFGSKIMGPGIGESKLNQWPRDKQGNLIGD